MYHFLDTIKNFKFFLLFFEFPPKKKRKKKIQIFKGVEYPQKTFFLTQNWSWRMSEAHCRSRALCTGDRIRYCIRVYVYLRSFGFWLTMATAPKSTPPTRSIYGGLRHRTVVEKRVYVYNAPVSWKNEVKSTFGSFLRQNKKF